MHEVLAIGHIIINYLATHWDKVLALFGGAAGLWAFAEVVLRKLHVTSKTVSWVAVHGLALVTALSAYLLAHTNVGATYPALFIGAEAVHRFVESKTYTETILPFLQSLNSKTEATNQVVPPSPTPDNPFAAQ